MTYLTSHERAVWLKNKANIEVLLYKLKCSLQCFKTNKELDIIESQRLTGRRIITRIRSLQAIIVTGRLGKCMSGTSKMGKEALTELTAHISNLNSTCS